MTSHDGSINLKINEIVKTVLKSKNDGAINIDGTTVNSTLTQSEKFEPKFLKADTLFS